MRKFNSVLFALIMLLALCFAQTAGAESFENRVGLLRAMGLIDVFSEDGDMDAVVTRGEFASIIKNFTGDDTPGYISYYSDVARNHPYAADICAVTSRGFMIGDEKGKFYPDEPINGSEAITVCVKVLGYQELSENGGGYTDGYMRAASRAGLSGFGGYNADGMTRRQVCELIFKALDCRVMDTDGFSGADATYIVSDETLGEAMFSLYKTKGRVTATPVTGLYSKESTGKGEVRIDSTVYDTALDVIDKIGRYVCGYYTDIDDETTLIYMYEEEGKDTSLVLKSSDIDGFGNYVYTYNNSRKTAAMSLNVSIIYNGVFTSYDELLPDEINPADGEVRLISTSGSSKLYDIAIITGYEYYTVKQVGTADSIIYDKYGREPLDMDSEEEDRYISHTAYGKDAQLSYYKENDILRVFKSKDNTIIYVSMVTDKITAIPQGCDAEENIITIDGVEYDCLDGMMDAITDKNGVVLRKAASTNDLGSFFLNEDKVIVAYVPQTAEDENVGLVMQVRYVPEEFDYEVCAIKILSGSEPQMYITAEKVLYTDPLSGTRKKLKAKELFDVLPVDTSGRVVRDVYLYKVNGEGYITELIPAKDMTKAENYQGYTIGTFTKDFERTGVRVYLQRIGTRYIPDGNTKVFRVPYDASASDDAYACGTASSIFGSDSRSNHLVVYGSNIDAAPKAVLVWTEDTGSGSSNIDGVIRTNPMVINKVKQTVLADGDIGYVIEGYQGGNLVEKETNEKVKSYSVTKWGYSGVKVGDLRRGDVILYDTDTNGRINYFLPMLMADNRDAAVREVLNSGTIYDYDAIAVLHTLHGYVIRSTSNTITVNSQADKNPAYNRTYSAGSANVVLVGDGTVEKITLGDIREGDEVFTRDYNHNLMDIVVFRD